MKIGCGIIVFLFLLSGCMGKNIITTYDETGRTIVQELSDDAFYYAEAGKAIRSQSAECVDCNADQKVTMAVLRFATVIAGKPFVDRGMNPVEGAVHFGDSVLQQAPVIGLGLAAYKLATRPSSVSLSGDGNTYSPVESHWTGNSGEGDYSSPYNFSLPNGEEVIE